MGWQEYANHPDYQNLPIGDKRKVLGQYLKENISDHPDYQGLSQDDRFKVIRQHEIEGGIFDPEKDDPNYLAPLDEEPDTFFEAAGKGVTHGTMGIAKSIGTGLKYAGGRLGSETLTELGEDTTGYWGKKAVKYGPSKDLQGSVWDKPELLANPSWWAYNVAEAAPSMAASMIPSVGAYKAIKVGGKALKLSKKVLQRLALIGGSVAGGAVGGGLEGTNTYEEVLKRGGTEEEAARAGELMTMASAGLNAVSNFKILQGRGALGHLKSGVVESITEYLEEPTEAAILGDDIIQAMKDGLNVMGPAFIMGGGASLATGGQAGEPVKPIPTVDEGTAQEIDVTRQNEMVDQMLAEEDIVDIGEEIDETPPAEQKSNEEIISEVDKAGGTTEDKFEAMAQASAEKIATGEIAKPKKKADVPRETVVEEPVKEEKIVVKPEPPVKKEPKKAKKRTEIPKEPVVEEITAPETVEKEIEQARKDTDVAPTEAQIEAGNYKKGKVKVQGLDIAIENPKGSVREGVEGKKKWKTEMHHDYGYIKGSKGADKDQVDVYIGDDLKSNEVYVVHQVDPKTGIYDEDKSMIGFPSLMDATRAYREQYDQGVKESKKPDRIGAVTTMSMKMFKKKIAEGGPLNKGEVAKLKKATKVKEPEAQFQRGGKAPVFYSQMERHLSQKLPNQVKPKQAEGLINSWLRKGEIKKEEAEWSGIKEWLAEQGDRKVSKEEIVNFLRETQVEVRDVEKRDVGEWTDEQGKRLAELEEKYTFEELSDVEFKEKAELNFLRSQEGAETKYAQYTEPGGKNYRELLLTLPQIKGRVTDKEAQRLGMGKGYETDTAFRTSHFDEPNILAHVRMNDRTDSEGNKVLFIEELQSDWHTAGRKRGYKSKEIESARKAWEDLLAERRDLGESPEYQRGDNDAIKRYGELTDKVFEMRENVPMDQEEAVPDAPFKGSKWQEMALKRILRYASENNYDKIAWISGEKTADRYDLSKKVDKVEWSEPHSMMHLYQAGQTRGKEISGVTRENLGDYVGKEVAKRLIDQAPNDLSNRSLSGLGLKVGGEWAKNLYDKAIPAFLNKYTKKWQGKVGTSQIDTTGQTEKNIQAEMSEYRVSEDKPIGKYELEPDPQQEGKFFIVKPNGALYLDGASYKKEFAERMMKQLEKSLSDKTIGYFIEGKNKKGKWERIPELGSGTSRTELEKVVEDLKQGMTTFQSLEITPAMKESVMEGQPLFEKKRGKATTTEPYTKFQAQAVVDTIGKAWKGMPETVVVQEESELPEHIQAQIKREQAEGDVRGVMSKGTAYIVAGNESSNASVQETFLHEVIGHYGIEEVLGPKLKPILRQVYASYKGKGIEDVARRWGYKLDTDMGRMKSAREMIATMAQKGERPNILKKVYALFREFLRKSGFDLKLTDADLGRLIGQSRKLVEKGVKGEGITVKEEDLEARFQRGKPDPEGIWDGKYALEDETRTDVFIRKFQDQFNRVKKVQKTIKEKGGVVVPDSDVYQAEELSSGKKKDQLEKFDDTHVKPFIKEAKEKDIQLPQIEEYLYAKHAPERNAYIRTINPDPKKHSGMSDEQSQAIIEKYEKAGLTKDMESLAKKVYDMNNATLELIESSGLESAETVQKWRKWDYYVPLKGLEGEKTKYGTGRGYDIRGAGIKRALGRESKASDLVAHSIAQAQSIIVKAENAKIGQALLKLAVANPDKTLWEIDKRVYKPAYDPRGDVIMTLEKEPQGLVKGVDYHVVKTKKGKVVYRMDRNYKYKDEVFAVRQDGVEHLITIKDEILAQQLKKLNSSETNKAVQVLGKVNRFLAGINTAFNPEFVITNFERDVQTALIHIAGEQKSGANFAKNVAKSLPSAMKGIVKGQFNKGKDTEMSRYYKEMKEAGGTIGFFGLEDIETMSNKIQNQLGDIENTPIAKVKAGFRKSLDLVMDANMVVENAARLGAYAEARKRGWSKEDASSLSKNLTVNFNRKGEWGTALNAAFLFYNAGIQGNVRVLQSVAKHKKTQQIVAGIAGTGFAVAVMNGILGGDDEDGIPKWDKIPDYVKENYFIMLKPGDKVNQDGSGDYFKVKLPYGYNVFWYAGYMMRDMLLGETSPMKATANLVKATFNAFTPFGSSPTFTDLITPTVLKPVVQSRTNIKFSGAPIKPVDRGFGPPIPESQKAWKGTSPTLKQSAEWLNEITGGSKRRPGAVDVSPETMKHYLGWVTGGMGMFWYRTGATTKALIEGEDISVKNVPFVRTLVGEIGQRYDVEKFYKSMEDVEIQHKELGDLKGSPMERARYRKEHRYTLKLDNQRKISKKRLTNLRDSKKRIEGSTVLTPDERRDRIKGINQKMRDIVLKFNSRFQEATEKNRKEQ